RLAVDVISDLLKVNITKRGMAWEALEPDILRKFLGYFNVDCVFDVGANIGQYGTRLRDIGFRGTIISFEPNPEAFATLARTVSSDVRWFAQEKALDSHSRQIAFNVMQGSQ